MPTYTFTPFPGASKTTSAGQGHIAPQNVGFSQRTNVHQYDPDRDVVGVINAVKPQHYTKIYVTTNFKTSEEMLPGQWIVLSIVLSARDHNGLPVSKFYSRDIAIGSDRAGCATAWQQLTVAFQGFPTQAQFLQIYIVRRASPLGGDFGEVPATQDLYVCSNVVSFGNWSNQPSNFDLNGYGFGYGQKYGKEL